MRELEVTEIDMVYGGGGCNPPGQGPKGNNGWGNGADPSNPGSDKGGTAPSKSCNCSEGSDKINTNPTDSDGR